MALKTRIPPRTSSPEPDFSAGWKEVKVKQPNGEYEEIQIPLTPEERLHPEEGYIMPESIIHARLIKRINDMLENRYANTPQIGVYSDLIVKWDKSELKHHCPDVMVIPHVQEREKQRSRFLVAKEGTRPTLIIEIVSPGSKEADRVTKVDHYARAGVQEYVYIDYWERTSGMVWELAGFRLAGDHYLPMLPDEEGSLYCETIGVRIGLKEGEVWMQDYESGEFLMTNLEAQAARQVAETQAAYAETRATEAEARATEAELRAAQEKAAREALEVRLAELEGREKS
ncbi:MAG TPA: Uma2 family endonuclease [Anaerolineales bacterium]|nr:Uma2 family endonuclease [Anaerolineales bacterium]